MSYDKHNLVLTHLAYELYAALQALSVKPCRRLVKHHYRFIGQARKKQREFLHLPAGVCYLLAAAAAFGGGYGLNALISKTPVLRWCVLGKRKEKRHVSG